MSLMPQTNINLVSCLTPDEFNTRLSTLVSSEEADKADNPTPEFKGTVEDSGFNLLYLLQPSHVKGEVVPRDFGSELNITVSLPVGYNALALTGYIFFTAAVAFLSAYLIGSMKYHKPISLSGICASLAWLVPSVAIYYVCTSALAQAHRWNEIVFEAILSWPDPDDHALDTEESR